ncbi:MAG TPA: sugar ABC transporter ATP-binding protein [Solirubrobacterales bacterium]
MPSSRLLKAERLRKDFPGLRALDDVSFELRAGEILAVVGQNGSGKSTLVKVLAGVYRADGGDFVVGGEGGKAAEMHFIHQNRALLSDLSTVENLALGRDRGRGSFLRLAKRRERRHAEELIGSFGVEFDVTRPISEISPAERTIVAIVRALDGWSSPENVLVLDEPTAELHGVEVNKLFDVVRRVADGGAGVIFISHRLDEVMSLADRVLALRDGRVVGDIGVDQCDHDSLIELIVGRQIEQMHRIGGTPGAPVLEAIGVGGGTVAAADLQLREGEVVGLSGIVGSGRESLAAMIFGARPRERGEVRMMGKALPADDVGASIAAGVAYVPPDRHLDGAVMQMSVRENLTLPGLRAFRRAFGRLDLRTERKEVTNWITAVGLRPALPGRRLELFSGGNQQKVVIAKWLRMEPRVLLLDEPTQGVDIGAKVVIYELVQRAARAGSAVLVSSADAKELIAICDRIVVMRDGWPVAELSQDAIEEERLMREELGFEARHDEKQITSDDSQEEIHV